VLTHELVHLALPTLPRRHNWLAEGIATYVEPIARARVGAISPNRFWFDLVCGIPMGLPEDGDRGLDHTPTWARSYWGGALYCLLADVKIREQTQNRASLDDALRAILAAGGNISVRWTIERVLEEGDRATATTVLTDLYREMADAPTRPDLTALWRRLGVVQRGRRVAFDDNAPLAEIRRSMTMRCDE
jgi:predicted metalloprotease with PDZ domain